MHQQESYIKCEDNPELEEIHKSTTSEKKSDEKKGKRKVFKGIFKSKSSSVKNKNKYPLLNLTENKENNKITYSYLCIKLNKNKGKI